MKFASAVLALAAATMPSARAGGPWCGGELQAPCNRGGCDDGCELIGTVCSCVDDTGEGLPPGGLTCGLVDLPPCESPPSLFECLAPLEPVEGICSEVAPPTCGLTTQKPCEDTGCAGQRVEVDGICEDCGQNGEPQCVGDFNGSGCDAPTVPVDGICVEEDDSCGLTGDEPCSEGGCLGSRVEVGGICEFCGKVGEPICPEDGCAGELFEDDGFCVEAKIAID